MVKIIEQSCEIIIDIEEKPDDCFHCTLFGAINILTGEANLPSLCSKNLLWFQCVGREGTLNKLK
ncbi:hypothetical protein LCGC14_0603300 [marine sediment metagenome]|uniref:Uncharacterized protein n=1 Tax=marine sediment metagenome TaxID=412755 RepID=A0A0F9RA48_9ZZZZ